MEDAEFEQFKQAFASVEGRKRYGVDRYSQAHAQALLTNYDRGVNTNLRGIFNQRAALRRAATRETQESSSARIRASSFRTSVLLVVFGVVALIFGANAAHNHTESVQLPCVNVQHLGEQRSHRECPTRDEPKHDAARGLFIGISVVGGGVVLWGAGSIALRDQPRNATAQATRRRRPL
uniref:hypothetical protein n=1 Tax=Curtobacterium poinsettiae TaxID=159612 RepID=UPI002B40BE29|nr:hypothetical protein [Curtobacterium flaccumfaciens]WQM79061.1 hypothetical protein PCFP21_045 [Curtobacterium flaccumfaciens pv. poinsettiae]WQM79241.1 hypothetical protein PCFP23_460 [Curtobacterium flaccumfaciens pv. poinsettiae]WQM79296.1 hypothetical protein PCFP24_230 [Curtobacterium flaccumfaciens pv. poinsettiae]WQM79503.1 hypothetical protein PCFP31_345 [Curtobacterium flaccumfaciens pv. poinsettiae]WRK13094.1 hypothetical protein PCFP22_345 [Curtobacterium flaccumfaciens pv. poins